MARITEREDSQGDAAGHALHAMHMKGNTGSHEIMVVNNELKGVIKWVLDSGVSHHMTPLFSLLTDTQKLDKPIHTTVPTGDAVLVERTGSFILHKNIKLNNVLYVPAFSCNLISIHKLTSDLNCTVTYNANCCMIQDRITKWMISLGDLRDGVCVIKGTMLGSSFAATQKDTTALWHSSMGHPSFQALQQVSHLLKCTFDSNKIVCCDVCHRSKQCRHSFAQSNNKAEEPFSLIHCDL